MATRTQLVRKVYVHEDGEEGRSAKPESKSLRFEFLAPQKDENDNPVVLDTRTIDLDAFIKEQPGIAHCAFGHGLSQKLGDGLAGIAGKAAKDDVSEDKERGFVDYALSLFDDALDNLQNGVWVAEGEGSSGSGNVTVLFEAIVAAFAKAGTDLTDEQRASVRGKLKDEQYRKDAKARSDVAAEVARITAERAAERAKKAAAKAKADKPEDDLSSLV